MSERDRSTEQDRAAAEIANEFNWRHYGVPAPRFHTDDEPCPRRQCRGRIKHSRLVHWFGWVRQ